MNRVLALERLIAIGKSSGAGYGEEHHDTVLKYFASGRLATNYHLAKTPGENLERDSDKLKTLEKQTKLGELLRSSDHFKKRLGNRQKLRRFYLHKRGGVEEIAMMKVDFEAFKKSNGHGFKVELK